MWLGLPGGGWYWRTYKSDDSLLPWCGAFIAWAFQSAKFEFPARYASARAWLDWGVECGPELGALAILRRDGGGHVGFVDAVTPDKGWIRLVGGNQGNAVSAAWFPVGSVLGFRKPAFTELAAAQVLALGEISTSQA